MPRAAQGPRPDSVSIRAGEGPNGAPPLLRSWESTEQMAWDHGAQGERSRSAAERSRGVGRKNGGAGSRVVSFGFVDRRL